MKREYMLDDVIAAISTPIGTGGIGIVRMSGAGCIALADSIFIGKKKLTEKATHTLSYGKITDGAGGEIIDEVLVSVMKAPHTYTKEDIVEINCHGGSLPGKFRRNEDDFSKCKCRRLSSYGRRYDDYLDGGDYRIDVFYDDPSAEEGAEKTSGDAG